MSPEDKKAAQKVENARVNAEAEKQEQARQDAASKRNDAEKARAKTQVESGELSQSQADLAFGEDNHLTGADTDESVRKGKEEVDPQFAGKNTLARAADLPVTAVNVAADQDKVVAADQEVRAALTQERSPLVIPDIPNAEGDDKKVVDGIEKAREDDK